MDVVAQLATYKQVVSEVQYAPLFQNSPKIVNTKLKIPNEDREENT